MVIFVKPKTDSSGMSKPSEYSCRKPNSNSSIYAYRSWKNKYFRNTLWLLLGLILSVSGCTIGPNTIERDRFDYSFAISESWKNQMLLNLVKIRYSDAPVFLEVTSIISQYGLEGDLRALSSLTSHHWSYKQDLTAGVKYYDRPTISYAPMTGEKFARSLLTPISPVTIVSFIQSGWPVDVMLRLTCDSISGIRNNSNSQMRSWKGDPEYEELLSILKRVQGTNTIAMRVEKTNGVETASLFFSNRTTPQTDKEVVAFKRLLHLDPEINEFSIIFGAAPKSNTELTVLSRSMLQVLIELAGAVNVPKEHLEQGQVKHVTLDRETPSLMSIHSGSQRPVNAFAAVEYNDFWFWVAKEDIASKRILSLLMLFFSLTESGSGTSPVITVGAG